MQDLKFDVFHTISRIMHNMEGDQISEVKVERTDIDDEMWNRLEEQQEQAEIEAELWEHDAVWSRRRFLGQSSRRPVKTT